MRLFLGVDVPDTLKSLLSPVCATLASFGVRTVNPDNFHVTIKFLGETPENLLPVIIRKLSSFPLIRLSTSDFGSFSQRVFWLGVESSDIMAVHSAVNSSLVGLFPMDNDFHPHITLARSRKKLNFEFPEPPLFSWYGRLALFRSLRGPIGVFYEVLHFFSS